MPFPRFDEGILLNSILQKPRELGAAPCLIPDLCFIARNTAVFRATRDFSATPGGGMHEPKARTAAMNLRLLALLSLSALRPHASGQEEVRRPAAVSTIDETELAEFKTQPAKIQVLIRSALALTRLNLTYLFGSNDPGRGGMDCSGTIHHLLSKAGIKDAPRQSDEMCDWVAGKSRLHRISLAASLDHPEFAALKPGDLIFWSGTCEPTMRRTPVSHVMLYLGTNQKSVKAVVFGASDGRRHEGRRRTGVSVFDLVLPGPGSKAAVHGYGSVPGLLIVSPASPIEATPQSPPQASKDP